MVDDPRPAVPPDIHQSDGRAVNPQVHYERTDANLGWLLGIGVGSVALAVIIFVAVLLFYHSYENYQAAIKKSDFPLAAEQSTKLPPEPRLEPIDRLSGIESSNVRVRHVAKEKTLDQYGPGAAEGFVRIPVERAMKLVLQDKELQARQEPAGDRKREQGLVDWGGPNSGRMFRGAKP